MRELKIIINEIKKIFSFKMICLLIVGSAIIYKMFISFYIDYFPGGRPKLDEYNIMVQMIEDYGHEMDETELKHLKNIYKEKLIEADEFLNNNKDFNEVGIYSYEDYENTNEKSLSQEKNQKLNDIKWDYLGREEGTIFWELRTSQNLISSYEDRNNYYSENLNENQEKRINEIIKNKENESILPEVVFKNYNDLIGLSAACIVIGITFMLTPLFLRDKKDKVEYLQYSSKHGRRLFKSKLIAGLISALIITSIELIICFILYRGNNTSMFFESNINSIFNNRFWFNITFIQYIILTVISIYIISIIVAFISMFISSKVNSYIAGIGVQVPTLFATCGLTAGILVNNLFILYIAKYLALSIYLALIIITVTITLLSIRKVRVMDITN